MPMGDPQGNFGSSMGYGGNFGGFGGASMGSSPGGPQHGMLGFGGMSPGGYHAGTYNQNAAGFGGPGSGVPGFGPRPAAAAAARQRAMQQLSGLFSGGGTTGGMLRQPPTSPLVNQPAPMEPIDAPLDPLMGAPPPTGLGYSPYGQPPGFGIGDLMPGARSNLYSTQPGRNMGQDTLGSVISGDFGTGYGPQSGFQNPQVNTGTKGSYGGGYGPNYGGMLSGGGFGGPR